MRPNPYELILITVFVGLPLIAGCGGAASGTGETTADSNALTGAEPELPPDPCAPCEERAAEAWNAEIRDEVDFSVKIYADEITAADAEWLATRMDRFSQVWVRQCRAACQARYETGTLSAEEHAEREQCFDGALEHQRQVVATLSKSGRDAGADMDELFAELTACVPEEENPDLEIRSNPFRRGKR